MYLTDNNKNKLEEVEIKVTKEIKDAKEIDEGKGTEEGPFTIIILSVLNHLHRILNTFTQ